MANFDERAQAGPEAEHTVSRSERGMYTGGRVARDGHKRSEALCERGRALAIGLEDMEDPTMSAMPPGAGSARAGAR